MRWLPLLTPVTYWCKLLGIRAIAAFLQLELFGVYRSNGEANRSHFQFTPLIFPFRLSVFQFVLPIFQFVLIVLRKKSCHTRVVGDVR
ncbi:MAG: hypothetical protein QG613_825 [Pseudomonadota bacterium]|nr:hypothetical protein [Pseudomonadota bacterium]